MNFNVSYIDALDRLRVQVNITLLYKKTHVHDVKSISIIQEKKHVNMPENIARNQQ